MDERALLARLIEGPVSGDALARASGQTRAAVWKRIQALRGAGVPIEAQPGRGYRLMLPFDLLGNDTLIAALPAPVRARMAALEVDWVVDSTNNELLRRTAPADGAADVLLAERQTGGRGRRGREWSSPLAAHLYLSLSRSFSGGLARLSGLSLVAGIATVEALHELGFTMVRLKWPNDLVVVGPAGELQKLGGLLVEGGGEHAGPARAVIGLGLNVRMPDRFAGKDVASVIDQPWCDLSQLSPATPSRNTLAATILKHWVPALDGFDQTGLSPLLARYAALDAIAGQPIRVQAETSAMTGVALGLAEDGSLRVRLDGGGERCFHSGEISVRRIAGAG
ncbi:MAG: bifunctional biotin--[acetyl-CoA-carboxylase] ligase/biotin operon repressor BirA [Lysobacter sp.]